MKLLMSSLGMYFFGYCKVPYDVKLSHLDDGDNLYKYRMMFKLKQSGARNCRPDTSLSKDCYNSIEGQQYITDMTYDSHLSAILMPNHDCSIHSKTTPLPQFMPLSKQYAQKNDKLEQPIQAAAQDDNATLQGLTDFVNDELANQFLKDLLMKLMEKAISKLKNFFKNLLH